MFDLYQTFIWVGISVLTVFLLKQLKDALFGISIKPTTDTGLMALKEINRFLKELEIKKSNSGANHRAVKEEDAPITWQDTKINQFYSTYVAPERNGLAQRGLFDVIVSILDILDKHGHCPSIVNDVEKEHWDKNSMGSRGYETLSRVTLTEHSLNTTTILIEDKKQKSIDYKQNLGQLLITGLAHDIGKIPELHQTPYKTLDHPRISQQYLSDLLPTGLNSRENILSAVREHHMQKDGSSDLADNLKSADHKARRMELKANSGQFVDKTTPAKAIEPEKDPVEKKHLPFEAVELKWLDEKTLLARIAERINMVENNKYQAFSLGDAGMAYVQPELIFEIVAKIGFQNNDYGIMAYGTNTYKKNSVVFTVRELLDRHIPPHIGKTFIGQRYTLHSKDGKTFPKPGFYLPIKLSAFDVSPSELEERKKGDTFGHQILNSIERVEIYKGD